MADFRARMEKTGESMFRAHYRGDVNRTAPHNEVGGEGQHILPDTHIGTDEQTVRAFVETLAKNRGFDRVIWE